MIEFKPEDILISVFRSSNQPKVGSWSYGHESGVMVKHLPTGLSYSCEEYNSQYKNKAIAIEVLQRKVQDYYINNEHPEYLGFPEAPKEVKRFFVDDGQGDIGEWDYVIIDSEDFDQPIAAFMSLEMAEQYCEWINNNYKGGL